MWTTLSYCLFRNGRSFFINTKPDPKFLHLFGWFRISLTVFNVSSMRTDLSLSVGSWNGLPCFGSSIVRNEWLMMQYASSLYKEHQKTPWKYNTLFGSPDWLLFAYSSRWPLVVRFYNFPSLNRCKEEFWNLLKIDSRFLFQC